MRCLVRHHHVLELLVDLDHLEFHLLSDVLVEVTNGLHVHLRTWQERFEAKHVDNQATLGAALDRTLDDHVFVLGLVHLVPSVVDASRLVAHDELSVGVFLLLDEHGNFVSGFEFRVVAEFRGSNDPFRFVTDVDHHFLLADGNDSAFHNLLLFDQGQA